MRHILIIGSICIAASSILMAYSDVMAGPLVDSHDTNQNNTQVNAPVTTQVVTPVTTQTTVVAPITSQKVDVDTYQSQYQSSKSTSGAYSNSKSSASSDNSVNIGGDYHPRNTPGAYAPTIFSGGGGGNDACNSEGISLGGSGPAASAAFGISFTTNGCERRKNSKRLEDLGFKNASVALMCQDSDVEEAMLKAGTPCPGTEEFQASSGEATATKSPERITMMGTPVPN